MMEAAWNPGQTGVPENALAEKTLAVPCVCPLFCPSLSVVLNLRCMVKSRGRLKKISQCPGHTLQTNDIETIKHYMAYGGQA